MAAVCSPAVAALRAVESGFACKCVNCRKPFVKGIEPFPCGQCLPCRINKRRLWTHRILLESKCHEHSTFTTLTYSPDNYPQGGNLVPPHLQLFLKRLRKAESPRLLRFFAVGEYGDDTERAHYHAVLFGLGADSIKRIENAWGLGFVDARELSPDLAQYVAGYTVKKLTAPDDPRLHGRHPEFARMSLRPGIGALSVPDIGAALTSEHGSKSVALDADVPALLRHGKALLPLGRYLRAKLREEIGLEDTTGATSPFRQNHLKELQVLRDAEEDRFSYQVLNRPFIDRQKIAQIEGKAAIYRKRSKL